MPDWGVDGGGGVAGLWAHSEAFGVRHGLVDHLRGTAELAGQFAAEFGGAEAAHWLGLAHDAGKASCAWQVGLDRAERDAGRVGVDHKTLGTELAGRRGFGLGQYVVHGHHGGLTNSDMINDSLRRNGDEAGRGRAAEAEGVLRDLAPELFTSSPVPLPGGFDGRFEQEFLIRFLFSCLVDADVLDTQAHRLGLAGPRVATAADMAMLWERLVRRRGDLLAEHRASAVDRWREDVYAACVAAAEGSTGLYRLTAPTGSGKTVAGAAFGVRHAAVHGMRRVVVAVPFITVTEQNARVYRRLLDPDTAAADPVVLEHHSAVALDDDDDGRGGAAARWRRLAAENWDASFVVTTTVQLFESLFGRRPAASRKVHRLANAVVVLDEVQALPHRLLPVLADGLRLLKERFGATVLLSSATQPELWELTALRDVPVRDVIRDPAPMYAGLRRVRYEWRLEPRPTWAEIAGEAAGLDQAMVVVNTVRDASHVHGLLTERVRAGVAVAHLSTRMCAQHRRDVLDDVCRRLGDDEPVLLVSTQLVEAGVDVDFPVVFRALAPADSLQQAAGRANREGRLGERGGRVVVVDPVDGHVPSAYRKQVDVTRQYVGPAEQGLADPDSLAALQAYYPHLYRTLDVEGRSGRAAKINKSRRKPDFVAVVEGPVIDAAAGVRDTDGAFRMVEDDSVPVVVTGYGDEVTRRQVSDWADQLRPPNTPDPRLLRQLQPYLASLGRHLRDRDDVQSWCVPLLGDLVQWRGDYDPATGLVVDLDAEDYTV
jgi:CRISPR-associated endonuclease/helicase Cas3